MKKGKFIVLEGVSGTGKETQARRLQQFLAAHHIRSHIVFHPSSELKKILSAWRKERAIDALTEIYLLLADRSSRVRQQVRPALGKGEWVISVRNYVSALVYQGKTEHQRRWIAKEFSRFEPKPDCLFYFDLTPKAAMERVMARHTATGEPLGKFETPQLLNEKRRNYKKVLQAIPHITLDANQSIGQIHQGIISHVHAMYSII